MEHVKTFLIGLRTVLFFASLTAPAVWGLFIASEGIDKVPTVINYLCGACSVFWVVASIYGIGLATQDVIQEREVREKSYSIHPASKKPVKPSLDI